MKCYYLTLFIIFSFALSQFTKSELIKKSKKNINAPSKEDSKLQKTENNVKLNATLERRNSNSTSEFESEISTVKKDKTSTKKFKAAQDISVKKEQKVERKENKEENQQIRKGKKEKKPKNEYA